MRSAQNIAWPLLILIAISGLAAPQVHAQAFGKNKVHYESLDWAVLETPHLRLHYYAEEESLARSLAAFAESVAVEYDGRFRMEPKPKVPLLLYSTHHLFQQTNATPGFVSEGVGGLTEREREARALNSRLKRRLAKPLSKRVGVLLNDPRVCWAMP